VVLRSSLKDAPWRDAVPGVRNQQRATDNAQPRLRAWRPQPTTKNEQPATARSAKNKERNMKLFVTGATGFIGSHFLNAAHAAGHEIVALRRSPQSKPRIPVPFLEEETAGALVSQQATNNQQPTTSNQSRAIWLDKEMPAVTASDLAGCDALVHLAAHTPNVPYDTLENCLRWNVLEPLRLFRSAIEAGIQRFVVAGSCFEYGRAGERYEFIPPDAPLEPTQTYPASKAAASVAFYQFAVEHRLQLSLHRIFQVFGEGEAESRLWPSLRRAALAGEDLEMTPAEQVRDFVPVEEVARQLLAACSRQLPPGEPLVANLGTGRPQTLRAFAEHWWTKWNAKGRLVFGAKPYRDGEVMRYVPQV
jgi:nucleoside-diphosphate-sugar epimerase